MTDAEFLQTYLSDRSEEAFTALVARYLPLVVGTAMRKVNGDQHLAQDVAQQVFTVLAAKAHKLRNHPSLAGWLHTTTRTTAAQAVRAAIHRRQREVTAQAMNETPALRWDQLAPAIDEALAELTEDDRSILLLRFFENKRFDEVGRSLGISGDAARMRVERALRRLEAPLARVGITSTAAAVTLALEQQPVWSAPASLATEIAHAAFTASAHTPTLLLMAAGKLKIITAGVIVAGAATFAVHHFTSADPSSTPTQPAARTAPVVANPTPPSPTPENLRRPSATMDTASVATATPGAAAPDAEPTAAAMVPIEQLGNRGFATPRDAFATQLWAAHGGDVALEARAIVLGPKARAAYETAVERVPANLRQQYASPEELVAYALSGSPRPVSEMQVLSETPLGPDDVTLHVAWKHEGSSDVISNDARFHRDSDGWKLVVPPSLVTRALAYLAAQPASNNATPHP